MLLFCTSADLAASNGPAIHVINLVNALSAQGVVVHLVAPALSRSPGVALAPEISLHSVPDPRRWRLPGALANLFFLKKIWQFRHADVLYIRSAPGSVLAVAFARLLKPRVLAVELNGWLEDEIALLGYYGLLAKWLAAGQKLETRLADCLRVVTPQLGVRAIAAGAPPQSVATIGNGTMLDIFRPQDRARCRAITGMPDTAESAVFVGNIWSAIDFSLMITALGLLHAKGRPVHLTLVGDGLASGKLADDAGMQLPAAYVHITGRLAPEDAALHIGAADITLAPFVRARNELTGLSPLKIRDYAACGRMVVASDLPGIGMEGCNDWLFLAKPEDAADFARAIEAALDGRSHDAEAAARQYAETHFGWDGIARKLLNALTS